MSKQVDSSAFLGNVNPPSGYGTTRPRRSDWEYRTWTLGPPGLAIGIAQIARSLAGGLIFYHPRDAISFRFLARFDLGACFGIGGRLPLGKQKIDDVSIRVLGASVNA